MSHVSTVKTEFDDKNSMKQAAAALKIDVKENVTADLGYGNRKKGDLVLTLQCGEQIALDWDEKKRKYIVHYDPYTGKIARELGGKDFPKLKQAFSLKKVEIQARKQGYRASKAQLNQKDGSLNLYLY